MKRIDGKSIPKNGPEDFNINIALFKGNILSCAGVFLQRKIAVENPFNEDPRIIASEDWELWLRIGSKYTFKYCPKTTSCLIEHPNRGVHSMSTSKLNGSIDGIMEGLTKDKIFMESGSAKKLSAIKAHMTLHVAYKFASAGFRIKTLEYISKALKANFCSAITQRLFYGIIKQWVFMSSTDKCNTKGITRSE